MVVAVLARPDTAVKIGTGGSSSGDIKLPMPQPVTLIVTEYDEKTPNAPFCGRRFDFVGLTVAEAVTKARTMEGFPNLKGKVNVNRTALHIDSPQVLEAGDTLTLLDP